MARPAHWERVIFFLPLPISPLQTKSYTCLPHGSEHLKSLCSPMPVVVSQLPLLSLLALLNPKPGGTISPFLFPSPATAEISSLPALLFSLFNTNQSSFCSLLLYNFSWDRVNKHPLAPAGARANRTKERFHPSLAWWINEIIDLVRMSISEGASFRSLHNCRTEMSHPMVGDDVIGSASWNPVFS